MKSNSLKHVSRIFIILMVVCFTSCGNFPYVNLGQKGKSHDPETEDMIDGTWETVEYESEDGMRMKMKETTTYDVSDHTYKSEYKLSMVSPTDMNLMTVKLTGTWEATSDYLSCKIDKDSFKYSFNTLIDKSEREEIKQEFRKYCKDGDYSEGGEIIELSNSKLILQDDDEDAEVHEYKRIK